MAERRMFAKTIIDSDAFLDMPLSTQSLYFHLSMRADDDGFINNPKKVQRMIGCSDDDLKLLIMKKFIIPFDSGIVVIKHWKLHNYIQSDRYKPTVYQDERNMLDLKNNKSYTLKTDVPLIENQECIQNGNETETQVRLGKDRIGKDINIYSPVIEYLNQKCNTSYKSSSNKTKTLIDARVNEGFLLEDFKKVIDIKASEWLNSEMAKYLRPETLFGTKFESYLNQKNTGKPKQTNNKFHNFIQSEEKDLDALARERFEKKIQEMKGK